MKDINDYIFEVGEDTIKLSYYWNPEKVIACCVKHNWYEQGTVKEYNEMLQWVREGFSYVALYEVAKNIYEHSNKPYGVDTIMTILMKESVSHLFYINEEE